VSIFHELGFQEITPTLSLAFIGSASARIVGRRDKSGCRGTFDNETFYEKSRFVNPFLERVCFQRSRGDALADELLRRG
jgi:hypothetical protein